MLNETLDGAVSLASDQRCAMDVLCAGTDVFLAGGPGSGKTYVLNSFIQTCRSKGLQVLPMAFSRGAVNNLEDALTAYKVIGNYQSYYDPSEGLSEDGDIATLAASDVVVIDEVSILRIDYFERMWALIQEARQRGGARQVVVAGDFHQMLPRGGSLSAKLKKNYPDAKSSCAFESPAWKMMDFTVCVLNGNHRYKDQTFAVNLDLARVGDARCVTYFNKRVINDIADAPDDALRLFRSNDDAHKFNERAFKKLIDKGAESRTFKGISNGKFSSKEKPVLVNLKLAVGERVVLLVNLADQEIEQGRLGTVCKLSNDSAEVLFDGESEVKCVKAVTWHNRERAAERTDSEGGARDEEIGTYWQLPLRAAYAMSVYEVQGKAFDSCVIDSEMNDPGMLYYQLSRCKSLEGLYIHPAIKESDLSTSEAVLAFDDAISKSFAKTKQMPRGGGATVPSFSRSDFGARGIAAVSAPRKDGDYAVFEVPAQIAARVQAFVDLLQNENK